MIILLLLLSCSSSEQFIILDNPQEAKDFGYEISKIDTLENGWYKVYIKD